MSNKFKYTFTRLVFDKIKDNKTISEFDNDADITAEYDFKGEIDDKKEDCVVKSHIINVDNISTFSEEEKEIVEDSYQM